MPTEEGSVTTQKPKESAVMTDGSLSILAQEIGGNKEDGPVMAMYLCVPNAVIVDVCNGASEYGLKDANETLRREICMKLLLRWKGLKVGCKEKEKVRELERALRDMGKVDIADAVMDRHSNNAELTADAFNS